MTARQVVDDLVRLASETELAKLRKRLPEGEEAIGLRMGDLFAVAKAHRDLPLAELELLLDHVAYEPRMTAFCILDFKAQRRLTEDQRRELYRSTCGGTTGSPPGTWSTAPPRGSSAATWRGATWAAAPARAGGDPLRRRTAITAPLFFTRSGSDADLAGGFVIAARLAADPVPGGAQRGRDLPQTRRRPRRRRPCSRFLGEHAATMPRPALRLAMEKLSPAERTRYREL